MGISRKTLAFAVATVISFAVAAPTAKAGTILSVTGPTSAASTGIFANQTLAISFTVGQSYSGVTISPDLIGSFSGEAYLMSQIGIGTTVADQIASAAFASTAPSTGALETVLQNVNVTPGTYYLVLSTTVSTPPQGLAETTTPVTVADTGASTPFGFYLSSTGNAFAPSDSFAFTDLSSGGLSTVTPEFNISTTSASTPEPATWTLLGIAFAALLCRKLSSAWATRP